MTDQCNPASLTALIMAASFSDVNVVGCFHITTEASRKMDGARNMKHRDVWLKKHVEIQKEMSLVARDTLSARDSIMVHELFGRYPAIKVCIGAKRG